MYMTGQAENNGSVYRYPGLCPFLDTLQSALQPLSPCTAQHHLEYIPANAWVFVRDYVCALDCPGSKRRGSELWNTITQWATGLPPVFFGMFRSEFSVRHTVDHMNCT